jgi:glycosyltransferase involved in cell wall biosynthesis
MESKPLLSIIIPTYNEEKDIASTIKSLLAQVYKKFEIIIVDDGSNDNTIKVASSFNKVRVLEQNHKGPGAARNLGVKSSRGEILIFVDADMTFREDYLSNLINPIIKDKRVIGTTHDNEIVENVNNIWSRCWGRVRVSPKNVQEVKIFRAIRKDKFLEFGAFDSKYGYADDQTFWFKYKIKPSVAKETFCYHKNPESLKSVYRQSRWIGASISNALFDLPIINYLSLFILLILSPIAIPLISIKRSFTNKDLRIILYMLIFISARYFGTLSGIIRKIYVGKNYR